MCVGSASPHFWRMPASASGDGFQTAAALTRSAGCRAGAGFAGSCATRKEVAAHSITRRIPLQIISPSRGKNNYLKSPYAQLVQKVKNDFQPHPATPCRAARRSARPSATLHCPQKNWGGFAPRPHGMPDCESTFATPSTEEVPAPIPDPSWKYQFRAARS
jgi:hypothetical protein